MIYLQLLLRFAQIGLFSFGGGYASLPLIEAQVVESAGWLTIAEFTDLITISQMTPGPIAINAAAFVGIRIAGPWGAIVATIGCLLPACCIVSLLAWLYRRYRTIPLLQGALTGLRSAIVALIASAGISMLIHALWGDAGFSLVMPDPIALILFCAAFLVLRRLKPDPILIMGSCGLIGMVLYLLRDAC